MGSHRFALAALAVACVAAAGGGSYLATRQNVATVAVPAAQASNSVTTFTDPSAPATPAVAPSTPSARAVPAPSRAMNTRAAASDSRNSASRTVPAPQAAQAPREEPHDAAAPPVVEAAGTTPVATEPVVEAPPLTASAAAPAVEPSRFPEPPSPTFDELVVPSESVIGLQTDGLITSDRARVEDRVEARVSRDVRIGGQVAIPAGARAHGTVVVVERGGRLRDRARLGIRFHVLELADGTRLPISTDTIFRLGESPSNGSAARIGGGAVAGAILGAIIGGGKGAAIGAATGAGAGTATVMAGDRSPATFPPGSDVTARILSPITVTVERE